jgi:hypothetical protein
MNDDVMNQFDPGYFEVARRLEAYADLRLTPSTYAAARMRASVMQAADRRASLMRAAATAAAHGVLPSTDAATADGPTANPPTADAPSATTPVAIWVRPVRNPWRRQLGALLAACLALGILAGTASAAKPGGALYSARLWIEMANLPTDPTARASAELSRLQHRLTEAEEASAAGDGDATQAALTAYAAILDEAERGSNGDAAASATIEAGLADHVAVLTSLVGSVPATARDAIEHALASSTKFLVDHATGGNAAGPGTNNAGGNGSGDKQGQPAAAPQPAKSAQPAKPAATDHPASTAHPAKPAATPQATKPDKTSKPVKPESGNGGGGGGSSGQDH